MSLLEDIFLQDEANEAQELERVIEGDEYDERPRSRSGTPDSDANSHKDDEAEEDKRRVDPSSSKTKRVTKNPRFILNPARLTGPRGIQVIPEHFKDFKFKGKGHEKEDLDMILKKLEHWAYRLYPKFQFEDCLKKIETLGKKRPVMVHLQKIRTDQFISEDTVVQKDSSDDEPAAEAPQEEDEFDKLLQQQIELARATPAPSSVKKVIDTPRHDRSPFTMPKATSSPSISDDQKERMMRNRRLAEERRLARLKQSSMDTSEKDNSNNISKIIELDEENVESDITAKKVNRSNVINSSDDECDVTSVNQAVTVDVHNSTNIDCDKNTDIVDLVGGEDKLDDIEMDDKVDKNYVEPDHDVVEIIDVEKNTVESGKSDKIVEINNHVKEIVEENSVSNTTQVPKHSSVLTIDLCNDDKSEKHDVVPINDNAENITENQNETRISHDCIEKDSTHDPKRTITDESIEHAETNKKNEVIENLEEKNTKTDESLEDIMDVDFSDDF